MKQLNIKTKDERVLNLIEETLSTPRHRNNTIDVITDTLAHYLYNSDDDYVNGRTKREVIKSINAAKSTIKQLIKKENRNANW